MQLVAKMHGKNKHGANGLGAHAYFQEWTSPFFDNPLLLQYGLLDLKGGLKDTLDLLISMEKQGAEGYYQQIADHMFEGATIDMVRGELEQHGNEGPGEICNEWFRGILHAIAELLRKLEEEGDDITTLTLEEIVEDCLASDAVDLVQHLETVAAWLPISNFKREQQVKTAKSGVHASVFRRTETLEVYMAASHRDDDCLYEASEDDFRWAEAEERKLAAERREVRASRAAELPRVLGVATIQETPDDDERARHAEEADAEEVEEMEEVLAAAEEEQAEANKVFLPDAGSAADKKARLKVGNIMRAHA